MMLMGILRQLGDSVCSWVMDPQIDITDVRYTVNRKMRESAMAKTDWNTAHVNDR